MGVGSKKFFIQSFFCLHFGWQAELQWNIYGYIVLLLYIGHGLGSKKYEKNVLSHIKFQL